MPAASQIRPMFARVAERYDRANHLLSLGIDRAWRRAVSREGEIQPGERVLDVCTGTGDLALHLARRGAEVTASDFCVEMLRHAHRKGDGQAGRPSLDVVLGDSMRLPFPDDRFDCATVAFGIRNVEDPVGALREMARVVRPGGRVLVLEFCTPRVPGIRAAYLFYFRRILPRLGSWITGDTQGAYGYLPDSVMRFPERGAFLSLMGDAGLAAPRSRILSLGIAAIYRGEVPVVEEGGEGPGG